MRPDGQARPFPSPPYLLPTDRRRSQVHGPQQSRLRRLSRAQPRVSQLRQAARPPLACGLPHSDIEPIQQSRQAPRPLPRRPASPLAIAATSSSGCDSRGADNSRQGSPRYDAHASSPLPARCTAKISPSKSACGYASSSSRPTPRDGIAKPRASPCARLTPTREPCIHPRPGAYEDSRQLALVDSSVREQLVDRLQRLHRMVPPARPRDIVD